MPRQYLIPAEHTTDQFTYHKATRTFVAEDSSLEGSMWVEKIIITNPKTKNSQTFIHHKDDKREGELMGRRFVNLNSGIQVLIIND